jgi:hypothetical protein
MQAILAAYPKECTPLAVLTSITALFAMSCLPVVSAPTTMNFATFCRQFELDNKEHRANRISNGVPLMPPVAPRHRMVVGDELFAAMCLPRLESQPWHAFIKTTSHEITVPSQVACAVQSAAEAFAVKIDAYPSNMIMRGRSSSVSSTEDA